MSTGHATRQGPGQAAAWWRKVAGGQSSSKNCTLPFTGVQRIPSRDLLEKILRQYS